MLNNSFYNYFKKNIEEYLNLAKLIILISIVTGIIYYGIYLLQNGFFPHLSNEEFIQIALVYFFSISIINFLIILFIIFIAELIFTLISENSYQEKISSLFYLLTIEFFYIYFSYYLIKYNKNYNFLFNFIIYSIFLFSSIIFYIIIKVKNKKRETILLILYIYTIVNIFNISSLLKITSKILNLGNYKSTLIIKNKNNICNNLPSSLIIKNKCVLKNVYIIWNYGKLYYIKKGKTKYKIPKDLIFLEKIN